MSSPLLVSILLECLSHYNNTLVVVYYLLDIYQTLKSKCQIQANYLVTRAPK